MMMIILMMIDDDYYYDDGDDDDVMLLFVDLKVLIEVARNDSPKLTLARIAWNFSLSYLLLSIGSRIRPLNSTSGFPSTGRSWRGTTKTHSKCCEVSGSKSKSRMMIFRPSLRNFISCKTMR